MVVSRMRRINRFYLYIFILACLVSILFYFKIKPHQEVVLKTVYNQIIPSKWQDRAKSLGYYCPSWNSTPGTISSSIYIKLAK